MLIGYIDESGSAKSHLFTLSCLIGHTRTWLWVEWAWLNCLEKKNKQLKAGRRKELSRFHAADCSSRLGEFKGWAVDEQKEFMSCLIRVFQRHPLAIISYTLDLRDLAAEFSEAKKNPRGLAHIFLLTHQMKYIADKILSDSRFIEEQIELVHDRSTYGAILLEAFNHMKNDATFIGREKFLTLSSKTWKDCILLQLADLLAYENFKIIERELAGQPRRKSMERILNLDSFGGRGVKLQRAGIREIKRKLDEESKQVLFANARIGSTDRGHQKRPSFPR
jgi:hypothetical protein